MHRPTKKARKDASVNGHTASAEKMCHDTIDVLEAAMRMFFEVVGCVPGLLKVGTVLQLYVHVQPLGQVFVRRRTLTRHSGASLLLQTIAGRVPWLSL